MAHISMVLGSLENLENLEKFYKPLKVRQSLENLKKSLRTSPDNYY